jgi:cytochrome c556
MFRVLPMMRKGRARRTTRSVMTIAACALLAVAMAGPWTARGEDRVPGLTGIDRPDDVVMARQTVMDGIEAEMMAIELALDGKELPLGDLKSHADRISTLLTAFPHLFPPQTKPAVAADGSPSLTTATLAIWQDFDAFYGKSQAAATTAYDASQAATAEQFREQAKKLRGACDGCHAQYMRVEAPPRP